MNPNFPQEMQNNINMNNQINLNQIIPNQNNSSIHKITIIKKGGQKQISQSNINYNQINNNLGSNPQIIKETKIITKTIEPIRFSFKDNLNLNLSSLYFNNNSYRQLVKKIASQLKKPVRPPTEGFFNFAFQKGEYSLIIIKRIYNKMGNQQIIFNNDIFRIQIQKYKKYKELIKRIAHLLKITMKNPKFYENK